MKNIKLLERLTKKAIEMYLIAEKDEMINGSSYVEFTERGMTIIDPKDLIVQVDATKKQLKQFKKALKAEQKKKPKKRFWNIW